MFLQFSLSGTFDESRESFQKGEKIRAAPINQFRRSHKFVIFIVGQADVDGLIL